MSTEAEKNFLCDLSVLLTAQAVEAKVALAAKKKEGAAADWESGQLHGLYRAVSLIEQQAKAFGFTKNEIGLAGFSADSLLSE